MAISKAGQLGEGGIMKLAPIGDFLVIEKGIVVFSCRLNIWAMNMSVK